MTTNWFSEYTYFNRSDESEVAILPQKYDPSPDWRSARIFCDRL